MITAGEVQERIHMTEKITLELSDNVVQQARITAERTGRAFEQVLADWIARGAQLDPESLILHGEEYPIYTPFGNEEAARVLLETLKAHQSKRASE